MVKSGSRTTPTLQHLVNLGQKTLHFSHKVARGLERRGPAVQGRDHPLKVAPDVRERELRDGRRRTNMPFVGLAAPTPGLLCPGLLALPTSK